jgi:photosystem II stability/assembly factor-like uncharacterized protein
MIFTKKLLLGFILLAITSFGIYFFFLSENDKQSKKDYQEPLLDKNSKPFEHFFLMRNYPDNHIDISALKKEYARISKSIKNNKSRSNGTWNIIGPCNIGGRFNEVLVHPTNRNIIYAGNATGGIFKTTDGGASWMPIFDDFSYLSIGEIVFDPNNPNILYVGTGDPNIGSYTFIGNGVYKSTDAGNTWTHLGLDNVGIVSRIAIDPQNSNNIYVATMGIPFERNTNRGLYKSTDGGLTWNNVLYISDDAGIIDLVMDHSNPQVLYAAGWNRIRNNHEDIKGGQAGKIYKTTDGGANWNILTNGLPAQNVSRIGMCMSGTNSNVLYAMYIEDDPYGYDIEGIYKTIDGGASWNTIPSALAGTPSEAMGGFGWYFGQIRVNPTNDNELFVLGIQLYKTTDCGNNWTTIDESASATEFHVDKHDLVYMSNDTLLCATDGGLYKSVDGGQNWTDIENIPNNQFYRIAVDPHNDDYYCGGVQDNGTNYGTSNDINNWEKIPNGDGFQPIFDPTDPNLLYIESQHGGIEFYDMQMGMSMPLTDGINSMDRCSWDQPFIMSSGNNQLLYTATYRVYKHTGGTMMGSMWSTISGDLTEGVNDKFHVITTLCESPVNNNNLYSGSSDGLVHRSTDAGSSWQNVTGTLPDRYVTCVKASPTLANRIFVAHSGYRDNEFIPHIHVSDNNGDNWTDISGNMPQIAINDICILAGYSDQLIFTATDVGVYFTEDGGANWDRVGNNMPIVPVYDIDYDPDNNHLIAGTYGRSMMSIDLDSVLSVTSLPNLSVTEFEDILIYPTITNDKITIKLPVEKEATVMIFDLNGKMVLKDKKRKSYRTYSLNKLSPGVYTVIVTNGISRYSNKIIKQ